ncbi:hypothetical protein AAZV13_06G218000 [Glycine max]
MPHFVSLAHTRVSLHPLLLMSLSKLSSIAIEASFRGSLRLAWLWFVFPSFPHRPVESLCNMI